MLIRSIRKIAALVLFTVIADHCLAGVTDDCLSRDLSASARLDACASAAQNSKTSRSLKAFSWLQRGYILRSLGMPKEALTDFNKALALYPEYAEAHLGRGLVLMDADRPDDAEQAFTAAIAVNSDLAEAFNNRGIVRGRTAKLEQAIEDYTQAIRLKSSFSNAFNNRGTAYYEKKLFQRALIEFDEALRLSPERGDILYNRAVTYAALGKTRQSLREFNTILNANPDYARALFNRGELHERLGDRDAAVRDWKRALAIEPDLSVPESVRKLAGFPQPGNQLIESDLTGQNNKRSNSAEVVGEKLSLPKPDVVEIANADTTARKKVALVIGNGDYKHTRSLPNPTNDARAIARELGANGFTIHSLALNNERNELIENLQSFSAAARDADVAIVFFAGHGLEVDGKNFLIPADAKLAHQADLAFEAIALEQMLSVVEEASQLGVVILDACRDNPFLDSMQLSAATRSASRGLRQIEPRRGVLVAYAAKHGTVAYDGQGQHSPYTRALLENISSSDLDVSLMFRRVSDQVWKATNGRQLPYIYGSLPGEVVALVNDSENSDAGQ